MSPITVIFFTIFIDLIGFGIIIPLMPFYAETFGATALIVGLLSTSFSLMQFLFAPLWGRLSDRIGRRPVILIGLFGSFASYMLFGLAHSLAVLFIARIFAGIAGANISTAQAYIADITTPDNRARGMGMVGAAFGLGFVFGPAIGGFLSRFGYQIPSFFAAGLSLLNFMAALFVLPESHKTSGSDRKRLTRMQAIRAAATRPGVPQLLLIFFIVTAAFSAFEATFALFSERRFGFGATTIGYVFAYVGVVLSLVQGGLVGRAVKALGERTLVPPAILTLAIGLALIPLAYGMPVLLLACGLLAIGMGFNTPSIQALISKASHADEQGSVLGVSQSMGSLARILGPAWGGYVYDHFGTVSPYLAASGIMLIAFVISIRSVRLEPDLSRSA